MTKRDSQRQRLYRAQTEALLVNTAERRVSKFAQKYLVDDTRGQRGFDYPSVKAVQNYVDAVRASAAFQRRWGYRPIKVWASRGSSFGRPGVIQMSADHRRNEAVILHEIAHGLAGCGDGHGEYFAATFLELVKIFMGSEDAARLRAAFSKHRVKYRAAVSRVPKPNEGRLARARLTTIKVGKPTKPLKPRAEVKKQAPVVGYDASYSKGYAAGLRGSDSFGDYEFKRRHPDGDPDAWVDGWFDAAAGRERFHMRECKAGRVECDEHTWSAEEREAS